jgi:hypothetical protein
MNADDLVLLAYTNGSKLFWALVAIYAMVLVSRWLDRRLGISFREEYGRLSGLSRGVYFAARWIGIAIVVSAVFSG